LGSEKGVYMLVRTRKLALTEGITAGILFGTAAIFVRFLQKLDTFYIAFWRLIIACLTLAVILMVLGKSFNFNLVRKNLKELLVLSFFLGIHFIFFISATMALLEPIGATVLGVILFQETPTPLFVFGAGLILLGILFIVKEKS